MKRALERDRLVDDRVAMWLKKVPWGKWAENTKLLKKVPWGKWAENTKLC